MTFLVAITAINMDLNWIARRLPPDRPELEERLQRVLRSLGQTVEWKQGIIDHLRPSHLDTLGLAAAIRSQLLYRYIRRLIDDDCIAPLQHDVRRA